MGRRGRISLLEESRRTPDRGPGHDSQHGQVPAIFSKALALATLAEMRQSSGQGAVLQWNKLSLVSSDRQVRDSEQRQ